MDAREFENEGIFTTCTRTLDEALTTMLRRHKNEEDRVSRRMKNEAREIRTPNRLISPSFKAGVRRATVAP